LQRDAINDTDAKPVIDGAADSAGDVVGVVERRADSENDRVLDERSLEDTDTE